jgi:hypothetical protein
VSESLTMMSPNSRTGGFSQRSMVFTSSSDYICRIRRPVSSTAGFSKERAVSSTDGHNNYLVFIVSKDGTALITRRGVIINQRTTIKFIVDNTPWSFHSQQRLRWRAVKFKTINLIVNRSSEKSNLRSSKSKKSNYSFPKKYSSYSFLLFYSRSKSANLNAKWSDEE